MKQFELLLKFEFEASHSLSGYEVPHPHLWKLEVSVAGKPIQGKILDLVLFRERIELVLKQLSQTYLNESSLVDESVRNAPTCETLSVYFWQTIHKILQNEFVQENPSAHVHSISVAICDLNRVERGAVRLS